MRIGARAPVVACLIAIGSACEPGRAVSVRIPELREPPPEHAVCAITAIHRSERDLSTGTLVAVEIERWWFNDVGCMLLDVFAERGITKRRVAGACDGNDRISESALPRRPADGGTREYDAKGRIVRITRSRRRQASELSDSWTTEYVYDTDGRVAEKRETSQRPATLYGRVDVHVNVVRYIYEGSCASPVGASFVAPEL